MQRNRKTVDETSLERLWEKDLSLVPTIVVGQKTRQIKIECIEKQYARKLRVAIQPNKIEQLIPKVKSLP